MWKTPPASGQFPAPASVPERAPSLTGSAGANAYGTSSHGVQRSTAAPPSPAPGGNVTVSGTFNNPSATSGTGLTIPGRRLGSQPVVLTGSATVGNTAGTGLDIGTTAVISAGSGA